MRLTGIVIAMCIGLAALKAAAGVLALVLVGGLLVAGICKPAETLGFMAGCTMLSLLGTHPWAMAVIILVLASVGSNGPEST